MLLSFLKKLIRKQEKRQAARRRFLAAHTFPMFEPLETRVALAVTASFLPSALTLTVFGDSLNNTIDISRDAAGKLLVNGGAVAITGGTATVANTALIQVFGQAGNDNITLNESSGALPRANLFGGNGNDTLIGGSGADQLFGQGGLDNLLGKGGADFLFGGIDNDVLTGGDADDQIFGEGGNDRMVWNPGDDTDLNEGGQGIDTVEVNGGNGTETFTTTANGTRVRFDRLEPAPFSIDIGTSEKLVLNANGGDDSFSATGNLATLIQIQVDGGTGNDTLLGSNGNDLLLGNDGNDFIDGNQGLDTAMLGAGDDTFQWDPGDGNDVVEGQDGKDKLVFNTSSIGERVELSSNGGRLRLTRDVAAITMDANDVEEVALNVFGGADIITVNDLTGTDVTKVDVDLGVAGVGDGQIDAVIVRGTNGNDSIEVVGSGTSYSVVGLPAILNVKNSEAANDTLLIEAVGGNDQVTAAALPAAIVRLTVDGGVGDDNLTGSQGSDAFLAGPGNDTVRGLAGNDTAFLGDGDDDFVWNPGDGNDIVEGEAGTDELLFNGANISEIIDVVANGTRLLLARNVANVTMDTNGVEQMQINLFGGADEVRIGDLTGTGVTRVQVNVSGIPGQANDGLADRMFVNGTQGNETLGIVSANGEITVSGLASQLKFTGIDAGVDELQVNGQAGIDTIDASGLAADLVKFTASGGLGDDVFIGSLGSDSFIGGDGNDTALMGAGDDIFTWNPGDDNDILEGQGDMDTMQFNGANIAELIDISAVGSRVRFFRNVASVVMDLDDVEIINFNALGGADGVVINDLSGTDVVEINLDLNIFGGGGDILPDIVTMFGTNGDDVVVVTGDATGVSVLGLSARVNIVGAEAARDSLSVLTLDGDDVVEASGLLASGILLTANGGVGDDILIGGDGADTLSGGDGDDVLIGNGGIDVLDGGTGSNVVIQ